MKISKIQSNILNFNNLRGVAEFMTMHESAQIAK